MSPDNPAKDGRSCGPSSPWGYHRNSLLASPLEDEATIATAVEDADIDHETPLLSRNLDSRRLSLAGSYRRPSFTFGSSRPTLLASSPVPTGVNFLNPSEIDIVREEEQELLKDNHIIPPDYGTLRPHRQYEAPSPRNDGQNSVCNSEYEEATLAPKWDKAVTSGLVHTTYKKEAKVLVKYAAPLYVTFLLQYSLTFASLFSAGNLGKNELAAVTLASMTANITGYAIYQGTIFFGG